MGINYFEVYRTPNMGLFMRSNDKHVFIPDGMPDTKVKKLSRLLEVQPVPISVARSRLIGPLIALNSHGILLPRSIWSDELERIKRVTDLKVGVLPSKFTSIGNLVLTNNKGALISRLLDMDSVNIIRDVLDVEVEMGSLAGYHQVGAMGVATDSGAVVHPGSSQQEINSVEEILKVKVEPCTVNSGVPFVASGLVANNKNAIVGFLTAGPELAIITRAFNI